MLLVNLKRQSAHTPLRACLAPLIRCTMVI
nr:hypothetical protein [Escherichia coli]